MTFNYKRYKPEKSIPIGGGKMHYMCEIHQREDLPAVGEKVVISASVKTILEVEEIAGGNVLLNMKCIRITA